MASLRLTEILRKLAAAEVDFVVVGMLAGTLRGAPVTTWDLDIVHCRSEANVARLLGVLADIGATYVRDPRKLAPTASHLTGAGHQLLDTELGRLDCLGTVDDDKVYEDLLAVSSPLDIGDGLKVRVLELPALIELKRKAGRPKDLAAIPYLESTLEELEAALPEPGPPRSH
jgi:hypothetical protein